MNASGYGQWTLHSDAAHAPGPVVQYGSRRVQRRGPRQAVAQIAAEAEEGAVQLRAGGAARHQRV